MNKRMVFHTTGYILLCEALLMLLPTIVAWIYNETSATAFIISIAACALAGGTMCAFKPKDNALFAKEGFVIVSVSWVLMSAFGALPFIISGAIPNFIDAFFETVSGFTTTGATILTEVESLDKGILFWRSFTHWIGGMGVLVFVLVVLPLGGERSLHLVRAEVPGPTAGKLVPKMRNTAQILYGMYCGLTVLEVILLCVGGMPLYDSLIHAFGTAGTGGFSNMNLSVAAYNSAYFDYVISIFMLMFGVNFNLYYLLLIKRGREILKNEELRTYLAIVAFSVLAITINIRSNYADYAEAFRYALFQVSSIITTTGYTTADFNIWPEFSRALLVLLMFVGACASSTGGGLKVSRVLLMFRIGKRGVSRMLHPRAVSAIQMDKKPVEESVIKEASVYIILYVMIAAVSVVLLSLDGLSFETNFSAMAACFNNIGPGLDVVGAVGNYSGFTGFAKLILSFDMLAGRLEIFPMLILFAPSIWKGSKAR